MKSEIMEVMFDMEILLNAIYRYVHLTESGEKEF